LVGLAAIISFSPLRNWGIDVDLSVCG
jgi:hypothetical protein